MIVAFSYSILIVNSFNIEKKMLKKAMYSYASAKYKFQKADSKNCAAKTPLTIFSTTRITSMDYQHMHNSAWETYTSEGIT